MKPRQLLLTIAVISAVLAGWFGMNQIAWVWPFLLALSGILFAVASQQKSKP